MGCCISLCRTEKHVLEEEEEFSSHVQDKVVISQQAPPKTPKTHISTSNKISPSPPSPTNSASSFSSFTCTNATTSSCSSLSSGSSSILTSKDRSFSNEFLWSCVMDNPHIIHVNSIKECAQFLGTPNVHARKLDSPAKYAVAASPKRQSIPRKANGLSIQHKRVRSSSPAPVPTVTRQKSFRREPGHRSNPPPPPPYSLPSRISSLRSPSPSRRFSPDSSGGISTCTPRESCTKRMVGPKVNNNAVNSLSLPVIKETLGQVSPLQINPSYNIRPGLRNRETCIHRVSSKIDEIAVQEALAQQEGDSIPMEDLDNPLISLDCFIFL